VSSRAVLINDLNIAPPSGNNIFGEDIRTKLTEIRTSSERTAYILMDHIHPYPIQNYMLQSGQSVCLHTCVSELGIYGAFVG
jgi:hypothetical protein